MLLYKGFRIRDLGISMAAPKNFVTSAARFFWRNGEETPAKPPNHRKPLPSASRRGYLPGRSRSAGPEY
ncbi:hypothetical protein SUGI_0314760 [Cryptomeria japonica]|nr:hypothetical protein SUGI_0314760 [Cryptomeria japonica]